MLINTVAKTDKIVSDTGRPIFILFIDFFQCVIDEMPADGATRIGWSQIYGKKFLKLKLRNVLISISSYVFIQ